MRFIYVTSSLPFGPGETFVIPEVTELRRQGHEVLVVPMLPRGEVVGAGALAVLAWTVVEGLLSPAIAWAALCEAARRPLAVARCLGWVLQGRSPRLVLKNLAVFPKALWLARLARARGVDHLHAHWAATTSTMALVASEVGGVPWSFTAHRWDVAENNLLALKMRRARVARFISAKCKGNLHLLGLEAPPATAPVLHMGVALPPNAAADAPATPVVLCAGRLEPLKGQKTLLDAFARLRAACPTAELWFAGDGEDRDLLAARARDLGIADAVKLLGHVPHEELMAWYAAGRVTVVVQPSTEEGFKHEGIPVSLIEAMSYGVPVVGTATGGIPELLEGGAGVLVPQLDPAALAAALGDLITDPARHGSQGRAGRRRVQERFAIDKVMTELVARMEGAA